MFNYTLQVIRGKYMEGSRLEVEGKASWRGSNLDRPLLQKSKSDSQKEQYE